MGLMDVSTCVREPFCSFLESLQLDHYRMEGGGVYIDLSQSSDGFAAVAAPKQKNAE